jgi:putative PEP-CTERM system TPR-repeat lipoprotein
LELGIAMRKLLIIGLPVLLLLAGAGAAGLFLAHGRDPVTSARLRMAHGDMKGAELYLREALHQHPLSPEVAFLLGRVDLAIGNPSGAELEFRRARDRGYNRAAIILPLGQSYLQQHHFDEALRDFVVDQAPPGARADVLTIRAAALLSLGRFDESEAASRQAEAETPNNLETVLTAARIALARNDIAGAEKRADKLLAIDKTQADALLLKSEIGIRSNNSKAALADAQAVLSANPDRQDALLLEARAYAGMGMGDRARTVVQKLLSLAPKNIGANFLGAMLAIQAGDYATADTELTNISFSIGDLPRGFYFMAVTKLGMGQPAQAEEAITKFLSKSPDDMGALKLLAYIDLARHHPDRTLALLHDNPLAAHPDSDTLDLEGRARAMQGDVAGARQDFSKAFALSPQNVQILNRLAAAQLELGDVQGAEANMQQSLKMSPNQRLAGEALVQAALARGDIPAAIADVEQLRSRVGDIEEVGVLAAQVRIAGLDIAAGEAQLRDVLSRFPDSRAATLNLVRIYGLRGDEAAAEKLLENLLQRRPDDQGALEVLLPTLFADHHGDEAIAFAERAHLAAPDNVGITSALAGCYVRANQPERAVALLDRVSANTNPELDILRAHVLVAAGKIAPAEQAFKVALMEAPGNVRARTDLAALLTRDKNYDDAREVLRDGIKQSPGNESLLTALVAVEMQDGGIKAALATAATLRSDPQNLPGANALAGDAWIRAGDPKQGAEAYLAALKTAPSSELAVKAAEALTTDGRVEPAITELASWASAHPNDLPAHAVLSSLYLQVHNVQDAEQQLDAVLAIRHNDVSALNNLAWVKQQQGDLTTAKALGERAYFETPLPEVADTLGWILAQQGDTAKALLLLSQAINAQAPAARAIAEYHYGSVLNTAGRVDDARTQLARAVASKAAFPDRDKARALLASLK